MFGLRQPHARLAVIGAIFGAFFAMLLQQLSVPLGTNATVGLVTLFSVVAAVFGMNIPAVADRSAVAKD